MECDARDELAIMQRAEAAPYVNCPPTPWWFAPVRPVSGRALRDEHELAPRAVRGFAHVQHAKALSGQTRFNLVAGAEPQRRIRGEDGAVGQEPVGVAEGDDREA